MTKAEKKEQQEQLKGQEDRVKALAQRIKNKELTHFFFEGKWYPIDGLYIDFPDFREWHILYGPQKRKQNKLMVFLHKISESRFRGG